MDLRTSAGGGVLVEELTPVGLAFLAYAIEIGQYDKDLAVFEVPG